MTRATGSRVSGATSFRPLRTRETVAIETPARSAIWRMVRRLETGCAIEPLKHVPERSGTESASFHRKLQIFDLDFFGETVVTVPEPLTDILLQTAPTHLGEKGQPMRRRLRTTRCTALAVVAGAAATATILAAAPPAAVDRSAGASAHKCLVMTGSGDPAFVRNFNPYTATGLPSGSFVQGAFYEPLVITGEGGLKPVPWLARSWTWSNGNKTLTLALAKGVKWSD